MQFAKKLELVVRFIECKITSHKLVTQSREFVLYTYFNIIITKSYLIYTLVPINYYAFKCNLFKTKNVELIYSDKIIFCQNLCLRTKYAKYRIASLASLFEEWNLSKK